MPVRVMTVREQLESLGAHNAYHFGRIVLLRQVARLVAAAVGRLQLVKKLMMIGRVPFVSALYGTGIIALDGNSAANSDGQPGDGRLADPHGDGAGGLWAAPLSRRPTMVDPQTQSARRGQR
jgi:hypothetical protein